MTLSPPSSPSSLFSATSDGTSPSEAHEEIPNATLASPPIPGLSIFPSLLPSEIAHATLAACQLSPDNNQSMFFSPPPPHPPSLPPHLLDLLSSLSSLLSPVLPKVVHRTAFAQLLARQAILNVYQPGEGITSHVDLLGRYADGVIGVSLAGGCVMTFKRAFTSKHANQEVGAVGRVERYDVYLPPRSVYVLSGEARWEWEHGIEGREYDSVEGETKMRSTRVSVTFRWMKAGGDLLS